MIKDSSFLSKQQEGGEKHNRLGEIKPEMRQYEVKEKIEHACFYAFDTTKAEEWKKEQEAKTNKAVEAARQSEEKIISFEEPDFGFHEIVISAEDFDKVYEKVMDLALEEFFAFKKEERAAILRRAKDRWSEVAKAIREKGVNASIVLSFRKGWPKGAKVPIKDIKAFRQHRELHTSIRFSGKASLEKYKETVDEVNKILESK